MIYQCFAARYAAYEVDKPRKSKFSVLLLFFFFLYQHFYYFSNTTTSLYFLCGSMIFLNIRVCIILFVFIFDLEADFIKTLKLALKVFKYFIQKICNIYDFLIPLFKKLWFI